MESYYGVIYFRNGNTVKTGLYNNEKSCERDTCRQFDQYMKTAISDFFKPTRYEVKVRK